MSDQTNIHWTHDPELLEQFALHRVEETRRKELEAHLLTCDECQRAVSDEQKLILGIKRTGRDQMKSRLKEQLAAGQRRPVDLKVSWTWVYSAAAVLVLIFGLSIYNRWLPFQKKQFVDEQPMAQQHKPTEPEKGEVREEIAAQQKRDESKREVTDEARDEKEKKQKFTRLADQASRRADETITAEGKTPPSVSPSSPRSSQGAGVAQPNEQQAKNALEDNEFGRGIWADGVVLSNRSADRAKKALKLDQQAPTLEKSAASRTSMNSKTFGVTVQEYSLDDLPKTRQMRQNQLHSNTVQTQFGLQGNEIQLQLYRPQLKQLKNNSVRGTLQQVGADSVIVTLDGEQIGYKIQGGIDALTNTKKK